MRGRAELSGKRKTKAMAIQGRKARIDLGELEKLSALQCTDEEVAAWFRVSTRTIERRRKERKFSETIARGRAKGKISLRRMQLRLAEEGNPALAIWLGKQYLGQTEQLQHAYDLCVTTSIGIPRLDPARNTGLVVDAQFQQIAEQRRIAPTGDRMDSEGTE
jgi:hypothetical protein